MIARPLVRDPATGSTAFAVAQVRAEQGDRAGWIERTVLEVADEGKP